MATILKQLQQKRNHANQLTPTQPNLFKPIQTQTIRHNYFQRTKFLCIENKNAKKKKKKTNHKKKKMENATDAKNKKKWKKNRLSISRSGRGRIGLGYLFQHIVEEL